MSADLSSIVLLDFGDAAADDILAVELDPTPAVATIGRDHRLLCRDEVPLRPDIKFAEPEHLYERIGSPAVPLGDHATVELIVANVIEAARRAPGAAVFYSRDRNHYSRTILPERYVRGCYAYPKIMRAVGWLASRGLIEHRRTAPSAHAVHRSRMRVSAELVALCDALDVVSRPKELIILKDAEGRARPYNDSRAVDRMRRDVREQNEAIASVALTLSGACDLQDQFGKLYRDVYRLRALYCPLRRIFNGGWTSGGRWYGPRWQSLPKRVRAHLLIDGDPVVECDFRACHPRLLAALVGIDLPFENPDYDPYEEIPHLPRRHVKLAFSILINAGSEYAASLALAHELRKKGEPITVAHTRFVVSEVRRLLPALHRGWRPSIGLHLQCRDAEICARVQRGLRCRGIPVLSVHDSFIVAERHASLLEQLMEEEMEAECRRLRCS